MSTASRALLSKSKLLALQCQAFSDTKSDAKDDAYSIHECIEQLAVLKEWREINGAIERKYVLKDFRENIAFVNALAWMFENQDHHPEMSLTYRECTVRLNTHSVNGISLNDFICAAKADALFERR
jgi:4a-hydroxytetrahydrobiopterin dehydratase